MTTNEIVSSKREVLVRSVSAILTPGLLPYAQRRGAPMRLRAMKLNEFVDRHSETPDAGVPRNLRDGLKTRCWLELLEPHVAAICGNEPLSRKLLRGLSMPGLAEFLETQIDEWSKK